MSTPAGRRNGARARDNALDGQAETAAPPDGLEVAWLRIDGERLAVLSYPLAAPPDLAALTPAEREVVQGLLAGRSNAEIARARGTSVRTVANQVGCIFQKLGLGSRRELASFASGRSCDGKE